MPDDLPSVVVVGSINIDHIVTASCFPRPGETILGTSITSSVGGKGANQAVAAALAGASVAMVARTGDDTDGVTARQRLAERGVQTTHVSVLATDATGMAWITVAENDNTIIVIPGANARWDDGGLPACVGEASVVLSQLEIPIHIVRSAAERARGKFVLNAAPAAELPDDLLALCDVLVVNEQELAAVVGVDAIADENGIVAAHVGLRNRGAMAVVTTRGAAGAVVTDADGHTTVLDAPRTEVVDTTGAGDAFTGVLAARLGAGEPLVRAARWGVVAGSLAVQASGAQDSYPDFGAQCRVAEEARS